MTEYIVEVPDEEAELFIARFGINGTTMFGYQPVDEIVRCRDCKYKDEPWNCAAPYYVEQNGFCAWGERMES